MEPVNPDHFKPTELSGVPRRYDQTFKPYLFIEKILAA